MDVLECESAEDAISILDKNGASVCFLFTDVKLAGAMTGTALAFEVGRRFPNIDIVVTSGVLPVEHHLRMNNPPESANLQIKRAPTPPCGRASAPRSP